MASFEHIENGLDDIDVSVAVFKDKGDQKRACQKIAQYSTSFKFLVALPLPDLFCEEQDDYLKRLLSPIQDRTWS